MPLFHCFAFSLNTRGSVITCVHLNLNFFSQLLFVVITICLGLPGGSAGKEPTCNAGEAG